MHGHGHTAGRSSTPCCLALALHTLSNMDDRTETQVARPVFELSDRAAGGLLMAFALSVISILAAASF